MVGGDRQRSAIYRNYGAIAMLKIAGMLLLIIAVPIIICVIIFLFVFMFCIFLLREVRGETKTP